MFNYNKMHPVIRELLEVPFVNQDFISFELLKPSAGLNDLIGVADISQLRKIATDKVVTSLKKKLPMIHDIMTNRGFIKLSGGTNRVVYIHRSYPDIVVKIAFDKTGINDNPAEYRLQKIISPICTKCYEMSDCGTVGLFERVQPITNIEMYNTVRKDIKFLISCIINIGYVLADVGDSFFMNWGIRSGFGPVLLDYPNIHRIDKTKLKCDKILEDGIQRCNGEICYDDKDDFLICSRCGKQYTSKDIALDIIDDRLHFKYEKPKKERSKMEFIIERSNGQDNRFNIGEATKGMKKIYDKSLDNSIDDGEMIIVIENGHRKYNIEEDIYHDTSVEETLAEEDTNDGTEILVAEVTEESNDYDSETIENDYIEETIVYPEDDTNVEETTNTDDSTSNETNIDTEAEEVTGAVESSNVVSLVEEINNNTNNDNTVELLLKKSIPDMSDSRRIRKSLKKMSLNN